MIKVFPALLAPLFLRYLLGNRRKVILWGLVFGATVAVLFVPTVLRSGLTAATAPYRYQLSRELEFYSIYGWILPRALGTHAWKHVWFRDRHFRDCRSLCPAHRIDLKPSPTMRGSSQLYSSFCNFSSRRSGILWLAPLLVPLARFNRRLTVLERRPGSRYVCQLSDPIHASRPAPPGLAAVSGGHLLCAARSLWRSSGSCSGGTSLKDESSASDSGRSPEMRMHRVGHTSVRPHRQYLHSGWDTSLAAF